MEAEEVYNSAVDLVDSYLQRNISFEDFRDRTIELSWDWSEKAPANAMDLLVSMELLSMEFLEGVYTEDAFMEELKTLV